MQLGQALIRSLGAQPASSSVGTGNTFLRSELEAEHSVQIVMRLRMLAVRHPVSVDLVVFPRRTVTALPFTEV